LCSLPIMAERGHFIADEYEVRAELYARLPTLRQGASPTLPGQSPAQDAAAHFAAATA
jgi:hypothetical protein